MLSCRLCCLCRCPPECSPGVRWLRRGLFDTEMEIEEAKAERVLRENNGDAVAALRAIVNLS